MAHRSLSVVTAAADDPITLEEAKVYARITTDESDAEIADFIKEAVEEVEREARVSLVSRTYDLFMDEFPDDGEIRVPMPPLSSVTTVKYTDEDGNQQTWTSSLYDVDTTTSPGRIRPAFGEVWPSIRKGMKAVEIRLVAGYADAASVPQRAKSAVKSIVASLYEFRGRQQEFALSDNPHAKRLIDGMNSGEITAL